MAAEKTDIEHVETHNERRLSDTIADLKKSDTLDTLHNDEAVKVLAGYGGDETWSAAEEKKVIKHIDRRLLPILIITYGLQYYDKAMLSQAVCVLVPFLPIVVDLRPPEKHFHTAGQVFEKGAWSKSYLKHVLLRTLRTSTWFEHIPKHLLRITVPQNPFQSCAC